MKECSRKRSTDGATRQASGTACRGADGSVHGGGRSPRFSRTAPRACVVWFVWCVEHCAQCICRVHRCISAMQCVASIMLELHDPTWSYSTPTDPRGSRVLKGARGCSRVLEGARGGAESRRPHELRVISDGDPTAHSVERRHACKHLPRRGNGHHVRSILEPLRVSTAEAPEEPRPRR